MKRARRSKGDRQRGILDRVVGHTVCLVRIGIPARDPEDPLPEDVRPRVRHPRARPAIVQHARQRRRQAQRVVSGFEQDRAPIRAGVGGCGTDKTAPCADSGTIY